MKEEGMMNTTTTTTTTAVADGTNQPVATTVGSKRGRSSVSEDTGTTHQGGARRPEYDGVLSVAQKQHHPTWNRMVF